ncbi:hypothetical protein, partial [Bacteroides thetaiotaomicron]|uniref:hypothetical protein n=1 Tax=Bacteroides thetaiotaomicron TaxID=818 RepID=UPI0039C40D53
MSYMLHLCYNVLSFVLKQKKEPKKNSRLTFSPTRFLHYAKGQGTSLRSNSLPFLTLRCGRSLDGEKSRPGDRAGGVEQWEEVRGMCG